MLKYILTDLRKEPPQHTHVWKQYMDFHKIQVGYIKGRYLGATQGYESNAVQLLRSLLGFIELKQMTELKNDFTIYTSYLQYINRDLAHHFDTALLGKIKENCFVKRTGYSTDEYLISVNSISLFNTYPFGRDWNHWSKVKAVTIIDHDSPELNMMLFNHQLTFSTYQPNYMVIAIDPIILTLQYYHYVQECKDEEKGQREFLHKYVLVHMFEDLMNIWILKQLTHIVSADDESEIVLNKAHFSNQYGKPGQRYLEACKTIFKEVEKLRNGTLRPNKLICSPYLFNDQSLLDRANLLTENLFIASNRQYLFLEFMRDLKTFDIITDIYLNCPDINTVKSFKIKLKYMYDRLIRTRIWNNIGDSIIRDTLETEIRMRYNKF